MKKLLILLLPILLSCSKENPVESTTTESTKKSLEVNEIVLKDSKTNRKIIINSNMIMFYRDKGLYAGAIGGDIGGIISDNNFVVQGSCNIEGTFNAQRYNGIDLAQQIDNLQNQIDSLKQEIQRTK